jgi:hypothetical protein
LRYIGGGLALSKLYQYSKSILVNWTHLRHLLAPLSLTILIYAECIDLDERNQQVSTPGRSSGSLRPFRRLPVMNLDYSASSHHTIGIYGLYK